MADTTFMLCSCSCTVLIALVAAYIYMKTKNTCEYVSMWSNNDMTGTLYCAKPGTLPSDLPFVPQSFSIPAGHGIDLVGVSSTGSRHVSAATSVGGQANTVSGLSPLTTSVVSLTVT